MRPVSWFRTSARRSAPHARRRARGAGAGHGAALRRDGRALPRAGRAGELWFWTVRYAAAYVTEVPSVPRAVLVRRGVDVHHLNTRPFWIAAAAGLVALWATPWSLRARVFVTGLLAASFLAICPGFTFVRTTSSSCFPRSPSWSGPPSSRSSACSSASRFARRLARAGASLPPSCVLRLDRTGVPLHDDAAGGEPLDLRRPTIRRGAGDREIHPRADGRVRQDRSARIGAGDLLLRRPVVRYGLRHTYPLVEIQPFAARMQEEMIRQLAIRRPEVPRLRRDRRVLAGRARVGQSDRRLGNRYAHECFDLVGIADISQPDRTRRFCGR